jgi:hypothetical protein
MRRMTCFLTVLAFMFVTAATASAGSFFFSTGAPDGRIATASRPESHRKIEIESADDFILVSRTVLREATFTGLVDRGGRAKSAKCG